MPGNVETHDRIDHLLVGEFGDAYYKNLAHLEEIKLPDEAIGFNPAAIFSKIEKLEGSSRIFSRGENKWLSWPRSVTFGSSRGVAEKQFVTCINEIGSIIAKDLGMKDPPRKWTAKYHDTPVPHENCKRKPDGALMNTANADSTEKNGWETIFALAELKTGVNSQKPEEKLAHSARLVFGAQPDRVYVLGVTVHNNILSFVVFNRGGLFISDRFDVHTNPERLIRIVGGMMFADRKHMGFDPTMKLTRVNELEPFNPYITVDGDSYDIVDTIYIECVIRGRATVCFKVKGKGGKVFVVKSGWVDVSRREKEPAILKELKGVPGITEMISFEQLAASTSDDFEEVIRRGHMSVDDANEMRKRMEMRKQVRVVLTPFASSILKFTSLKELVHAFLTLVEGTQLISSFS